jgi:hypothetical protein
MTDFAQYSAAATGKVTGWRCQCHHGFERHLLPMPPGDGKCTAKWCTCVAYKPAP